MKGNYEANPELVKLVISNLREIQATKNPSEALQREVGILKGMDDKTLTSRVEDLLRCIPEQSQQTLLDGGKIKGIYNTVTLTTAVKRNIVSNADIKNFIDLDAVQYDPNAKKVDENAALGGAIRVSLTNNKAMLDYDSRFRPAMGSQAVIIDGIQTHEASSRKEEAVIVGLATGMIAKIAGHKSEFSKAAGKGEIVLSSEVIQAAYNAAEVLAKTDKYRKLAQGSDINAIRTEAMKAGKAIGKEVRAELFSERSNPDVPTLTDIITKGRVKGKSVDDALASVAVSEKKDQVDMDRLDSLAAKLKQRRSKEKDSSSSSRSDDSNKSRSGSFVERLAAEKAAPPVVGKGSGGRE